MEQHPRVIVIGDAMIIRGAQAEVKFQSDVKIDDEKVKVIKKENKDGSSQVRT